MEILRYKLNDTYLLQVSTTDIRPTWSKFSVRVNSPMEYCNYTSNTDGELSVYDYATNQLQLIPKDNWHKLHPIFFETNTYSFSIQIKHLKDGCTPKIIHPDKRVEDMFNTVSIVDGCLIMGTINFINEPGRFDLCLSYITDDGSKHIDHLFFDVVSPKLDTKSDLGSIITEIRQQYDDLVFRYLTLTFQQYSIGGEANNDLIWFSIFKEIIDGYIHAVRYILQRPHQRYIKTDEFSRIEKIKRPSNWLTERFADDYNNDPEKALRHYYQNTYIYPTEDTNENRFVKHSIDRISKRFESVVRSIKAGSNGNVSENEISELQNKLDELWQLRNASLFRTVGRFNGFKQESLVLQQRTGYAQIYRYWILLQNGLELIDGRTAIGILPIWQLYELWCFLMVKKLTFEVLGIDTHNSEHVKAYIKENKETVFNPFSDSKMQDAVSIINPQNGDIVEIGYQYVYSRKESKAGIHSLTSIQKPDIVMRIKKSETGFVLTYLFDAKYRVLGDNYMKDVSLHELYDEPIPDTLNQMHRYRDALYYGSKSTNNFAKEVIGGYIIFPGRVSSPSIISDFDNGKIDRLPYFLKSIFEVNIGAFPLLPTEAIGKTLLSRFIKKIVVEQNAYEQLITSIPQKGLSYTISVEDEVLVGYYASAHILDIIMKNKLYYVRAGIRNGSLEIMPGIDRIKYILLYNGSSRKLYHMDGEGPIIISGKDLISKGFDAKSDYYFAFKLSDNIPAVTFEGKTYNVVNIIKDSNHYNKRPYLTSMKDLLSMVDVQ